MAKELIITSTSLETKLAILEDDQVTEIFVERTKNRGILGNVYKGRVTRVLPGMQAAFVDIGLERHAFLYVADFFENIEEYEEFLGSGEGDRKARPEGARSRRSRRPRLRRRDADRGPRRKPSTPVGEQREASAPEQPAPIRLASRTPAAAPGEVLPNRLELSQPLPERRSGRSSRHRKAAILPDQLSASQSHQPAAQYPDREVEVRHDPGLPQFATRPDNRRRRSRNVNHQALIGSLLREGQEILVQIAKEPIGRKGARLTSHIALPGRYVVFMPTVDHVGVSRKISSEKERIRLRDLVLNERGEFKGGFIVRTVAAGRGEDDFIRDMTYLTRLWEDVRERAEKGSAPVLVHSEPGIMHRIIRDYVSADFRAIRVDDEQEYARIVEFVSSLNPDLVKLVRFYNGRRAIFDEYGINAEIEKALKHKVWLKNGGHIVINQTEALVAIDVNTGKFVGSTDSLEETITRTNLGAVREVVRQIRLRDLGGIIVIDFIDMDESRNRQKVMEALQAELAKDKAPFKILRFNEFGLVAITRKRVKQSLEKSLCQPCAVCSGTGMTKSVRTISYSILQEARRLHRQLEDGVELLIRCHPEVARALRDTEREVIREIEAMTGKAVSVKPDSLLHIEHFDLVEC